MREQIPRVAHLRAIEIRHGEYQRPTTVPLALGRERHGAASRVKRLEFDAARIIRRHQLAAEIESARIFVAGNSQ